jgi:VIT1/CCC1 family predicted Fe2+/Mn2+ transporter/ferritin-like protein
MATLAGSEVAERLLEAWRDEVAATIVYELIARRESDPARAGILRRMAEIEQRHRDRLEQRMRELDLAIPDAASVRLGAWQRLQARYAPVVRLLAKQEAMERRIALEIEDSPTGDPATDRLLDEIKEEERGHTVALAELRSAAPAGGDSDPGPQGRLSRILGRERWHQRGGGWISGVIYGANDGLAAVFGIVAGVSGATGGSHLVLTAGLAGAIASSLSMATGAFLAERSGAEVHAANIHREREELLAHPEEEKEELALFYQLKGLTEHEARAVVERIAEDPEQLLAAISLEEFGTVTSDSGAAARAALAGGLSTAAGAIVPVVPFFFLTGVAGVVAAASVSLLAHFAVGAAKSLFTLRSVWSSGFEMTVAGAIVGGATYLLGLAFPVGA